MQLRREMAELSISAATSGASTPAAGNSLRRLNAVGSSGIPGPPSPQELLARAAEVRAAQAAEAEAAEAEARTAAEARADEAEAQLEAVSAALADRESELAEVRGSGHPGHGREAFGLASDVRTRCQPVRCRWHVDVLL
jgi:hypothetical protein